jgi:hypothetical protein
MRLKFFLTMLIAILLTANTHGALTTNSWAALGGGKWEGSANWDHGVPSINFSVHRLAPNGGLSGVTTIDELTVASNVVNGCMTVSNVTLAGGFGAAGAPFTLALSNVNNPPGNTTMTILDTFTISSKGSLSITNSRLKVLTLLSDDGFAQITTDGNLTNGSAFVGNTGVGQLVMVDGTWQVRSLLTIGRTGGQGTVRVMGGIADINQMILGSSSSAGGTIWVTGGELDTIGVLGGTYPDAGHRKSRRRAGDGVQRHLAGRFHLVAWQRWRCRHAEFCRWHEHVRAA